MAYYWEKVLYEKNELIKKLTIENEVLKKTLADERKARIEESNALNQKIGQLNGMLDLI